VAEHGEVLRERLDEPPPLAEPGHVEPGIWWLGHHEPDIGVLGAPVGRPAAARTVRPYLVLAVGDVVVELGVGRPGVEPLASASHEQAVLGKPSTVDRERPAALVVEKPHIAAASTPGDLDDHQRLPGDRQQHRVLLTRAIPLPGQRGPQRTSRRPGPGIPALAVRNLQPVNQHATPPSTHAASATVPRSKSGQA
jgi:hypothetical protein